MAKKKPITTKNSPTYTRATTPTAMSIATIAIVITSIRLYGPLNCFRVSPLSSSHQGPRPSFGGAKVLLMEGSANAGPAPRLPIPADQVGLTKLRAAAIWLICAPTTRIVAARNLAYAGDVSR